VGGYIQFCVIRVVARIEVSMGGVYWVIGVGRLCRTIVEMKFQVVFIYDDEYEGYVADVPALPGCLSQGKTLDEATANVKEAILGYLEVLCNRGF